MQDRHRDNSSEVLQVYVRVRPPIANEIDLSTVVHVGNSKSISVASDKHDITCNYDHVFCEISEQDDIFSHIEPLLNDVLNGFNGCIFAYGQTSAGKTHTMFGPNGGKNLMDDRNNWGVLPRAAQYLLGSLQKQAKEGNLTYNVKASFLQIYNENLFDLLSEAIPVDDRTNENGLKIREVPSSSNSNPEVYVSGLSEFRVLTSSDILQIVAIGSSNRTTRSTDFNNTSSRSHAILQMNFEIETSSTGQKIIHRSKLSLVDLAGSEKMQALGSESHVSHVKELTSINKSLSSLGNVIAALTSSTRIHIPYRDSKLTRLLQDSLGGNTRTILIACVAPTALHTAETVSTLQFADRAKRVMSKVRANMVIDDKALLAKAQTEIARLKLLLKHTLSKNETGIGMELLEDGETADEMHRILQDNNRLRNEVESLKLQLQSQRQFHKRKSHQSKLLLPVLQSTSSANATQSRSRGDSNVNGMVSKIKDTIRNQSAPPQFDSECSDSKQRDNDNALATNNGNNNSNNSNNNSNNNNSNSSGSTRRRRRRHRSSEERNSNNNPSRYDFDGFDGYENASDVSVLTNHHRQLQHHRPQWNDNTSVIEETPSKRGKRRSQHSLSQGKGKGSQSYEQQQQQQQHLYDIRRNNNQNYNDNINDTQNYHYDYEGGNIISTNNNNRSKNVANNFYDIFDIMAVTPPHDTNNRDGRHYQNNNGNNNNNNNEEDNYYNDSYRSSHSTAKKNSSSTAINNNNNNNNNNNSAHEGVEEVLELDKLKQKLNKSINNSQLKKVEEMLNAASYQTNKQLQKEQNSLRNIQKIKNELEQQLQALMKASEIEANQELATVTAVANGSNGNSNSSPTATNKRMTSESRRLQTPTAAITTKPLKISPITNNPSTTTTTPSLPASPLPHPLSIDVSLPEENSPPSPPADPRFAAKESLISLLTSQAQAQADNSSLQNKATKIKPMVLIDPMRLSASSESLPLVSRAARSLSPISKNIDKNSITAPSVRAQSAAGLLYDKNDVNRTIQMFSFRFNSWENIKITDFESSRGLHKCQLPDGNSQWLNLKKKPVRSLLVEEGMP